MIYLASPYSSHAINEEQKREEEHKRYLQIRHLVAHRMMKQEAVFSPIVHCHEIAVAYDLPKDAAFWQAYNNEFIRRSTMLVVAKMPGWDTSVGIKAEREVAGSFSIPVTLWDVEELLEQFANGTSA